tara:strand:- start:712 stop:1029 length:318 start_codon:yes stop_codon:yes gene_type:complete
VAIRFAISGFAIVLFVSTSFFWGAISGVLCNIGALGIFCVSLLSQSLGTAVIEEALEAVAAGTEHSFYNADVETSFELKTKRSSPGRAWSLGFPVLGVHGAETAT